MEKLYASTYDPKKITKPKTDVIYCTNSYSMFTFLDEKSQSKEKNRDIGKSRKNKYIKELSRKNALIDLPIVVNKDMEILEGQGRFVAIRELKKTIYFKFAAVLNKQDIPHINRPQMPWSSNDYFVKFLREKKPEYLKLKNFINKSKVHPLTVALSIVNGNETRPGIGVFKTGDFKYPENDAFAWNTVEHIKEFAPYFDHYNHRYFMLGVLKLKQNHRYNPKRMMKKVKKYSFLFHKCDSCAEYFRIFNEIYNNGVSKNTVYLSHIPSKSKNLKRK